jgi:predicted Ser/Thr protein kinase
MNCPRCNSPAWEDTLREFGGVCPKCLLHFAEEQDAPAFPSLEIVEMIGQGGMGVVYKAIQKNLGRTVALKVLSPQLSSDPEFVERFTREAKALAQLNHPNIVAIYDSGIHDRVPYLVMEYVKGQSLRQLLAAKQMTAPQALELVPQICDALYYAHAKGVVHRDIKPENILIDGAGRVKIADYGLAKIASLDQPRITKSNIAMGTPHYMAPEQIEKTSEVDHRADIYSLGVVIYEMLTGELPLGRFKAPSERAEVDRRLDPVVLKSLEREPDDRYQSANEMKAQFAAPAGGPESPGELPAGKVDLVSVALYSAVSLAVAACGLLFALNLRGAGVTFIFVGIMFLVPAVFRTMSLSVSRVRARRNPPPPTSKLAVASGILCLSGLGLVALAIILTAVDRVMAANVFAAFSALSFLASIVVSLVAATRVLGSRGALGGLWIATLSGFFSFLMLLIGLVFTVAIPVDAPVRVTTSSPSSAVEDEWKEPYDLPKGFYYEVKVTQDEAAMRCGLSQELRNAVTGIQYAYLTPGHPVLLYLRFVSPAARKQWLERSELQENQDGWDRRVLSGEAGLWLLDRGELPPDSKDIDRLLGGIRNPQPLRK